jgi:hypothetical protein
MKFKRQSINQYFKPVLRIRDVLSRIRIRPFLHPGSRIRGVKKHRIPDPTYFCIKAINQGCGSGSGLDPDSEDFVDRDPDPYWESGSRSRGKKIKKFQCKKFTFLLFL